MANLTDELKIINECITFASKNNLNYQVTTCPTMSKTKRIEINLGEGIPHSPPEKHFGASFATKEDGNLKYRDIHVYPLTDNHKKETENLRLYLENKFNDIKWV